MSRKWMIAIAATVIGAEPMATAMKRLGFAVLASWLICGALGLTLPAPAHAACNGTWDLTGDWRLTQGNGYRIWLRIMKQKGNDIYGDARVDGGNDRLFFSGTFDGQYIEMTIPAAGGIYSGGIDDLGHIGGTTHNSNNTESTEWNGDRAATCMAAAAPPPPPPPLVNLPMDQFKPVDPNDKLGIKQPEKGFGQILKETKP